MLQFNTQNLKKESVLIKSTDAVFANTELANKGFTVEVTDLSKRLQTDLLYSNVNDNGTINQGSYQEQLFIKSITNVDGIVNELNQPITIEDGVAGIIYEYGDDLLIEEIVKTIQSFKKKAEKKS